MKKIMLASLLATISLNATATCPAALNGRYSGYGQYTEQTVINKIPVIGYIEYHAVSILLTSTSMTALKEYFAGTGAASPAKEQDVGTAPVTYDKKTCTGMIGDLSDPSYFTVSDSGNKITVIHGKAPNAPYTYAELWELTKQ